MTDTISTAGLYIVPLLLGVILHEIAHGWTAEKLGDPTARLSGRITLNPLVHVDPVGTVILPLILVVTNAPFLFGWAKPVPVRFDLLRGGRRAGAWVALSGPLTNLTLAFGASLLYRLILLAFQSGWIQGGSLSSWVLVPVFRMTEIAIVFNLVLMVVNLLPVPPLDGGRVMVGLLPEGPAYALSRLEPYGMLIVLLLIATGAWSYVVGPAVSLFLYLLVG